MTTSTPKAPSATQAEWAAAVEAEIKAGGRFMTRQMAVIAVARKKPELRKRLVAEANAGR